MAEPEVEAAWRAEFKRIGENQLRDALNSGAGIADEPKRQAAFRWLGDEAAERRLREEKTYHYVRWTFCCRYRCRDRRPYRCRFNFLY